MREYQGRSPYMDFRNSVPFMDLSGYIVKQPKAVEDAPCRSLQESLLRKKFSLMINLRRMQYCRLVEEYRNGRR